MHPNADPGPNGGGSRSHSRTLVLLAATAFGIYLCYRLAEPFVSALVWALTLTVLFAPFHGWLESKLKHRNLAAVVSTLVVGLIVVVPAAIVGQRLILQAANGAHRITANITSGDWQRAIEARPHLAFVSDRIARQLDLPGAVQALAAWLTSIAGSILKGSVVQVLGFLLTLYFLFFFLRDRRAVLRTIRSMLPLSEVEMDGMLARVSGTIYATIYGALAVAAAQGLLGGLMFWCLGLPTPLLWGVAMAVLALVPVLGSFVVWIPAAVLLALDGHWGKALILALWGGVVVSTVDNLLRPLLVGKRMKLHTVLAFISVVGGLILFGPAGLILGPVVLTITTELLKIWQSRTAAEAARVANEEKRESQCSVPELR